jgi:hypothetical protein
MPVSTASVARRYVVAIPRGGTGEPPREAASVLWEVCRGLAAGAPRAVRIELFTEPFSKPLAIDVAGFSRALARVVDQALDALNGRPGRIEVHAHDLTSAFAEVDVRVRSETCTPPSRGQGRRAG